jgi:hypothetical protein
MKCVRSKLLRGLFKNVSQGMQAPRRSVNSALAKGFRQARRRVINVPDPLLGPGRGDPFGPNRTDARDFLQAIGLGFDDVENGSQDRPGSRSTKPGSGRLLLEYRFLKGLVVLVRVFLIVQLERVVEHGLGLIATLMSRCGWSFQRVEIGQIAQARINRRDSNANPTKVQRQVNAGQRGVHPINSKEGVRPR